MDKNWGVNALFKLRTLCGCTACGIRKDTLTALRLECSQVASQGFGLQ
jgi:hypothetical protein